MEGDVLGVGVSLPVLLSVGGVVVGGVWSLLVWFARRMLEDIDERLARIDQVASEVSRVDAEVKRLIAELPLHYQRRDDAIREYTSLNAKIDRIYEVMMEMKNAR